MQAKWAHFQWFSNNPLTDYERLFLRRARFFAWNRIRYVLLVLAIAVSLTPLWLYLDANRIGVLLVMVAVIYLAHVVVGMRTMLLAIHSVTREQRAGTWPLLVLTGIDARRIVWGKWWAVVRHVWKDHALMALPRVGLAFGLAQFWHSIPLSPPHNYIVPYINRPACSMDSNPFCYFSYASTVPEPINPQIWTGLLGGLIILLFGIAEAGLMASLGLFSVFVVSPFTPVHFIIGITGRLLLVGCLIGALHLDTSFRNLQSLLKLHCDLSSTCRWPEGGYYWPVLEDQQELHVVRRTLQRIFATTQEATSTLGDSSTLLASNVMRPFGEKSLFGMDYAALLEGKRISVPYGNVPFVLRNLVSAILGLALYALVIVGVLRLAERAAVRRHGALRA